MGLWQVEALKGLKAEGKSSVRQKLAPLHTPPSCLIAPWLRLKCPKHMNLQNLHEQRVQTKKSPLLTEEKLNLCKSKIKKGG